MMNSESKIYILGAGAIGCLLASYFYRAQWNVTLILKDEQTKTRYQKTGGVTLLQQNQDFFYPIPACIPNDPIQPDFIFVTTKAFQVASALKSIQHQFRKNTWIIFLNNGLGCYEEAFSDVQERFALLGMHYCAAIRHSPFRIEQIHISPFYIGRPPDSIPSPSVELRIELLNIFETSQLEIVYEENIIVLLWKKLTANCIINPLTTLIQCKNGKLLEEHFQVLIHTLCKESVLVVQKLNIALEFKDLVSFVMTVIQRTADNYSSMLQDRQHQRQTEINYLNGYLCQQAHKYHVSVPGHLTLLHLIQGLN